MAYFPFATEFNAHYRLVGADGISVAVFNDDKDPNYVGALTEVTGLDSAEVRESASDAVEADGGTHGVFYLGRRPISMTGRVFNHASILERNTRLDRARRASLALRGDSTLSWKPSTRKENLLPYGTWELGTTGWTFAQPSGVLSGTVARSNVYAHTGTWSMRVQATHDGTTTAASTPVLDGRGAAGHVNRFPVVPGRTYTASVYVNVVDPATAASGTRLRVYWYKADGTASTVQVNNTGSYQPTNAVGLVRPTGTWAAPSDAAFGAVYIETNNTWTTANDTFDAYYDSIMVEAASSAGTYFDGDTSGYFWKGDAHASPSGDFVEQFTVVRRAGPFRESGQWVKEFQIPLVSEYAYIFSTGLKTVAAGVAAENRGNMPAYPIVSITGASTNPTVSDGTRTFRTTGLSGGSALAASETVEFDMQAHTGVFTAGARSGQSANRYIDWALTGWPYLTGLGTTQTFTLTGGGTLSVRYRDAWA